MDLEKRPAPAPVVAPPEGCLVAAIRLPVRIVVLVLVVPVRLVWDALVTCGRFLYEKALVPLARGIGLLLFAVLVWPLMALGRYVLMPLWRGLAWLGRVLLVVPALWWYARVLAPVGRAVAALAAVLGTALVRLGWAVFVWPWVALWRHVLVPLGHGLAWLARQLGAGAEAVGRAVALLLHVLLVVPVVWLYASVLTPIGHALRWLGRVLVVVPVVWLYTYVFTPVGHAIRRTVVTLVRWIVVLPAVAVWRWVLVPVGRFCAVLGREIRDALGHAWRVAGYVSRAVGRFLGRLLRWVFVEPVRWAYRSVLTPLGHFTRDQVWRPAVRVGREIRAGARQARAEVRRMLFGTSRAPEPLVRQGREPDGARTRTLGSSTTSLTKTVFTKD
ncbi:hypothetical protein V2W30_13530 [Streptomyces sp. Q6]|uniref:Uncharacterized protein n=1 Tax=Streptomyces citrinus TaxID=3118173 RepID=A0ACD5AAW0_9ACTN